MNFDLLERAAQVLHAQRSSIAVPAAAMQFSAAEEIIDISKYGEDEKEKTELHLPSISSALTNTSHGYLGITKQDDKPPHINQDTTLKLDKTAVDAMISTASTIVDRFVETDEQKNRRKQTTTAGAKWFDMPAVQMTPELERELKVIRMRNVLDPKRFYKKDSDILGAKADKKKGQPLFFQIGTVVDSALDGIANRIPKKLRKKSIVDELLADDDSRQYLKKRFNQVHQKRLDNRRRGYNAVHANKKKGFK